MSVQEGSNINSLHSADRHPRAVEAPSQPIFQPVGELDLQELFRKLMRRKWVILGTVTTVMFLVAIILSQLIPRYTSVAYVEINPQQSRVVDFEAVLSGLSADSTTMETQIEVLRSRTLISRTVERLKLLRDPEFNIALQLPGAFATMKRDLRSYLAEEWPAVPFFIANDEGANEQLSEAERLTNDKNRVVDSFLAKLTVNPKGRSRVIEIQFESENRRTAALAANTLADFYIVAQLQAKFEATKRAIDWLSDRVSELRQEVSESERAVEEFRQQSGLVRGQRDATLASEQLSALSTQYVKERATLAEANARLGQVEKLLKSPDGIESVSEVLTSPLITDLRQQEAQLGRQTAEFAAEFGERHPKMINARAQIRSLREKISIEVKNIVQRLRNEVAVSRARFSSLNAELNNHKIKMSQLETYQVRLRALEREATASRTLLENLLARSKETSSQQNLQHADANILSYATVPNNPSFPNMALMLGASLVGAVLLGVLLAFAIEQFDQGFRSVEQIERLMGATSLGLIPMLSGLGVIGKKPENYILEKPQSAFGEAIRSLHTNVLLSGIKKNPKVILISSSRPKEGKTTVAISLARMLASIGHKVIVVDCDLRRPSLHKAFGVLSKPGLVEILAVEINIDEVIQEDQKSPAHIISAGELARHSPSLLGSQTMEHLLNTLAQRYETVILDSAPVLAVSDSLLLSRLADRTVFLVRWAETRRETANNGLKQLLDAGAHIAGVLLTLVDVKEHAKYSFGDSGAYTGEIKKYYTD